MGTSGRLVRTMAFFRKDLFEVLRQPRLLLTLVLGPFLILLIFGVGFAPDPPTLRTVLVVPEGSGLQQRSTELASALGSRVQIVAMTESEEDARALLADDEADVGVVVPRDAAQIIRRNQQAEIAIYHNQIDPFEASFIEIFAAAAIDDINREILEEVVVAGQSETADVDQSLQAARAAVDAMSAANDRGEEISPQDQITLEQSLVGIAAVMASQSRVVSGVEEAVGADATTSGALNRAQENSTRLGESDRSPEETSASLSALSADLNLLETELAVFQGLEPRVLVSPFVSRIENAQGVDINFSHYYVPGVVSLLLQHLALTFAALSLVRERSLGTIELFRVSPLTGGEALAGKYLAYLMLGGLVSAALTVAAIGGFGFQIAGSPGWYLLSLLLVMVAALGGGFVLSAIARTESEAVQYAMIALLISIFFSGFFISLDRLIPPVRVVSYLIPATYGIAALQDVAFLGQAPEPQIIGGSAALALLFVAAASLLIKTRVVGNGRLPLRRRRAL